MRAINVREQRSCSFHSSSFCCCCCPTLLTNSIHSCHLPVAPPLPPLPSRTSSPSTGCLWLCIFDLLSSFSYFLLFWHSQRLHWTHKGGQRQEVCSECIGREGEGLAAGQLHLPTLCACTLHMAQRRRRPVAVCMDIFSASISHFCVIFIPSKFQQLKWGGLTTEVFNYILQIYKKYWRLFDIYVSIFSTVPECLATNNMNCPKLIEFSWVFPNTLQTDVWFLLLVYIL